MSRTKHHRGQRKRRQYSDPRPLRAEKWKDDLLMAAFLGMEPGIRRVTDPAAFGDYLYVDIGPGVRISHMDQVAYVADDHAPGCIHVFRRNAFVMDDDTVG